jgi:uncharacterized damage-inducible protein DinB
MTDQNDLRYPVGHFRPLSSYSASERAAGIETLRALPGHLRAAVLPLDDAQLDTPYREGGWTVRQVVHHVADSHLNSYVRFKLALTEYEPTIKPYDEAGWALLPDNRMPVDVSLALTDSLHQRWVALLQSLTEKDFEKKFFHPQSGSQNLATSLALYAWHSLHHTAHITHLRTRMGW